eukprot:Selendium_serpulae@DN5954_c1_g1_i2.p1
MVYQRFDGADEANDAASFVRRLPSCVPMLARSVAPRCEKRTTRGLAGGGRGGGGGIAEEDEDEKDGGVSSSSDLRSISESVKTLRTEKTNGAKGSLDFANIL